jgi:DNA replication protein DnaC
MKETIKQQAKQLKLSYISNHIEDHYDDYYEHIDEIEAFLSNLFEYELAHRHENGIKRRIKLAKFPYFKYLDELELSLLPKNAQKQYHTLKSLQFIEEKQNVILAGNPGTGKTHLAIGLGIKAAQEGHKVYFAHVPSLIVELKETQSERKLHRFKSKINKYDLIILDELGYISFDKEGAELLFNLISSRCEKKATIFTTNLSFDRWDEIFHDPIITAAIVDRITHKSHVVNMNGTSYRYRQQESFINNSIN